MISGKKMQVDASGPQFWPHSTQLWQWSLALYPAIQPIALEWQDQCGVNVNLLLLLLYLQRLQHQLSLDDLQQLQNAVALQQQRFTIPLRQLRRQLPAHLPEQAAIHLKQQLLQAELCSEQLEQQQLIACLQGLPIRQLTATCSMPAMYLQLLQIDPASRFAQIVDLDQAAAKVDL